MVSGVTGRSAKAQSQAAEVSPAKDSQGRLVRTSEFVEYDLSTLKYVLRFLPPFFAITISGGQGV